MAVNYTKKIPILIAYILVGGDRQLSVNTKSKFIKYVKRRYVHGKGRSG